MGARTNGHHFLLVLLFSYTHLLASACRNNAGKTVEPNVEYLDDQGLFFMKCTQREGTWKNAGVACRTQSGDRIEVGSQLIKDELVHRCWRSADDSIHYDYQDASNITGSAGFMDPNGSCEDADGRTYRYGEQFVSKDKNFLMLCTGDLNEYWITAIHCLTKDGVKMSGGEVAQRGSYIYNCSKGEGGRGLKLRTGMLEGGEAQKQLKPTVDQCFDKNEQFENGKQFIIGQFVMSCEETPDQYVIAPTACVIKDGTRLEKNTEVIRGNYKYRCEPHDDGVLESIRLPL